MREIDIERIIKKQNITHIDEMTREMSALSCDGSRYGFRTSGSSGENKVARYIFNKMKEIEPKC